MNKGCLRGIGAESTIPQWAGGGDPVNDGSVLIASSGADGGIGVAPLVARRRRAGFWYVGDSYGGTSTSVNVTPTLGVMYFYAVRVERPLVIDQLGTNVQAAGTAGNCRLGIYADDGHGNPTGQPLADSGQVLVTSTGNKTPTLSPPLILQPGVYWLAHLTCNDVTGTCSFLAHGANTIDFPMNTPIAFQPYTSGLTTTLPNMTGVTPSNLFTSPPWMAYHISAFV